MEMSLTDPGGGWGKRSEEERNKTMGQHAVRGRDERKKEEKTWGARMRGRVKA